jgi:hypothetical protein
LELTVPAEMLVRTETQARLDLTWTSVGPLDAAALQVYVPADAHLEDGTPTPEVRPFPGKHVVYSVETSPVVAGQVLSLAGNVVVGPDPAMQQSDDQAGDDLGQKLQAPAEEPVSQSGSDGGMLRPILGAVAIALLVVAAYLVFRYVKSTRG